MERTQADSCMILGVNADSGSSRSLIIFIWSSHFRRVGQSSSRQFFSKVTPKDTSGCEKGDLIFTSALVVHALSMVAGISIEIIRNFILKLQKRYEVV